MHGKRILQRFFRPFVPAGSASFPGENKSMEGKRDGA